MNTKKLFRIFILFDLIILLALVFFLVINPEKNSLNETAHSQAPGEFIKLSDGYVHYELSGPEDGEVVVLVHGFSVPYYVWDPTVEALKLAGFRVLRYDLFGRGYSDRPLAEYSLDFFVKQLNQLRTQLIPDQSFHIMGLSMGAPVVAAFANQNPDVIKSITFVAPEVLPVSDKDIFPMNIPVLGEWVVGVYLVPYYLPNSQMNDFYQPRNYPDWEEKYHVQMQYKGFKRAILSTIRNLVKYNALDEYRQLATAGKPGLLIWGEKDRSISKDAIVELMQVMPGIEYLFVEKAGHLPHYEKPDQVNPVLINFLQSHSD